MLLKAILKPCTINIIVIEDMQSFLVVLEAVS